MWDHLSFFSFPVNYKDWFYWSYAFSENVFAWIAQQWIARITPCLPQGDEGNNRKSKIKRDLMGQEKNCSISEWRRKREKKEKQSNKENTKPKPNKKTPNKQQQKTNNNKTNNNKRTNLVMQRQWVTISHKQNDTQLFSKQHLPSLPSPNLCPMFIAEHDIIQHGISIWSACVNSPVLSQLLMHPQPTWWGGRVWKRENHDTVQALLSSSQSTSVLSTLL